MSEKAKIIKKNAMNENAAIFYETEEGYYFGIYVANKGGINNLGNTLIHHYDYDEIQDVIEDRWALSTLETTKEETEEKRIAFEYYVATLHPNALKHRQCFQYNVYDELQGESVDYTFIPYTHIQADYIYLKTITDTWLVSYDLSNYEFEDLLTNVELVSYT